MFNTIIKIFQKNARVRGKLLVAATDHFKNNRADFEYFLKSLVREEAERFPSLLNNGYLHIDKAIDLTRYLKLPLDNLIVDVGSAAGATPLLFSKSFPLSLVYAFEPIPEMFGELQKATSGTSSIHAINKALGSDKKQADLHLTARITSSSLLDIDKNISNEFWKTNLKEEGIVSISVSRLDDELPADKHVNILKMDVQGYELEVLKGAVETIKRTAIVLVEMQNHTLYAGAPQYFELDECMRKNGFKLFDMIPSIRHENKLYEWDAIYVNKKYAG